MILNPGTLIVPTKWNTTKRLKLCIVLGYDNGYYVSRALRSSLQKDVLDFFYCAIDKYEEIPDSKITFRSFTEEKLVTAIRGNYMVDYPPINFIRGVLMKDLFTLSRLTLPWTQKLYKNLLRNPTNHAEDKRWRF